MRVVGLVVWCCLDDLLYYGFGCLDFVSWFG